MASSNAASKDAGLYQKIPPRITAANSKVLGIQVNLYENANLAACVCVD